MIGKEKEALNLLSFPTFPDGLTTVAVPNTSSGLVVLAYPKDLDEFFAASLVKEDASSIPTPPPIAEKIKIVDLRNDKTIPAMLALWLGGQKPLDRYTQYTGQRMEQVMFEAGKHYRTQNGSKVRYSSTDGMICVFEVVVGCGEWHEGDVFYTQLNGLSWVADGGLDIVAPWREEGSK